MAYTSPQRSHAPASHPAERDDCTVLNDLQSEVAVFVKRKRGVEHTSPAFLSSRRLTVSSRMWLGLAVLDRRRVLSLAARERRCRDSPSPRLWLRVSSSQRARKFAT